MVTLTACPLCGGTRLTPRTWSSPSPGFLHHAQASCDRCGLLLAQPRATPEQIARFYQAEYYGTHWPDVAAAVTQNTALYRRYERPLLERLWAGWPPRAGGRVLEVGCGYGAMLPLLAELGYEASGCDPSVDAVASCRQRGLAVVEGTLATAALAPPYVLTVCQHVIEHVEDPAAFVRALVAVTEPGGVVAIVTEDAWTSQWAFERGRARLRGQLPRFHTSRDHTFVFSAPHLERLLRDAGCDEVRTHAFSYVPAESWHWKLYKGAFRTLDRWRGHGEYLMAVGRLRP